MRSNYLIIIIVAIACSAFAPLAQADPRFSLGASYLYGNVDGYVQTPSGGEPGSTSSHRPTLDEIGITNASIYDAQLTAGFSDNEFYAGGQWIRMSGGATLDQTLISQAQTFPAGTHVSSEVDLDWYRVGYRRRIELGNGDWTLWPGAGAAILDFLYHLNGDGATADRSYIKLNAQFGLETEWRPQRGRFSVDLILLASLPITPPLPQMHVEELLVKYRFVESARTELEAHVGVAFEQIYFEDDQHTPNHINADFGPMLVAGLNWHF